MESNWCLGNLMHNVTGIIELTVVIDRFVTRMIKTAWILLHKEPQTNPLLLRDKIFAKTYHAIMETAFILKLLVLTAFANVSVELIMNNAVRLDWFSILQSTNVIG